ncbi:MAG: extracellular solute-binding protein [Cellulosilyticum sp.]|nr:extracellular solute-binding protein [Cellulosilyticum sp.]
MNKKMVSKLLAASLATIMTAGIVGCGNAKPAEDVSAADTQTEASEAPAETTTETEETASEEEVAPSHVVRTDADGNPIDLGGMEIIIRDWWTADEEVEPTNAFEEAREEYYDWIQETYNFKIKQVAISDWGSVPEDFLNYTTSGGDENYIFILRPGSELVAAMNSGLMYDLSTLDCLDFSKDKWGSDVHKLMEKHGAIYGMAAGTIEPKGGMYFNKRLLQEAGIDPQSIYDLQESGDWTWEKFEEICKQIQADTNNDGVIDRYAMVNFASTFYGEAVASNDAEFIGKDDNGYYNALESEATMEALNWALDMISTYDYPQPTDSEWDYWKEAFINGNGAFIAGETYQAGGDWSTMEDDFGFVCFPKGPKASDYTNVYSDNPYCIPACYDAEKAWKLAFAYDVYTDPVPGFEDYNDREAGFYNSFRDTESVELSIRRLMTNGKITYHTMIPGLSLGEDVLWGINKDSTPAQQAEKIRNTWASYLEEANK